MKTFEHSDIFFKKWDILQKKKKGQCLKNKKISVSFLIKGDDRDILKQSVISIISWIGKKYIFIKKLNL